MKSKDIMTANQRLMAKRDLLSATRGERVLTSPATTPSMQVASLMEKIKALDEIRRQSRPKMIACPRCGQSFEPEWSYSRGLWHYPGFDPISQTCENCNRLREIRENIEEHLRLSGVPPKYMNCSFENFQIVNENKKAYSLCKDYIGNPSESLFIYGGWGVGKTHLAAAITRELVLMGKNVIFISVPRMLIEIRKAFQDDARKTEDACIEKYLSCNFLILDDFGIEKTTEWTKQTLDYIVYERDSNLKPTIITRICPWTRSAGRLTVESRRAWPAWGGSSESAARTSGRGKRNPISTKHRLLFTKRRRQNDAR